MSFGRKCLWRETLKKHVIILRGRKREGLSVGLQQSVRIVTTGLYTAKVSLEVINILRVI